MLRLRLPPAYVLDEMEPYEIEALTKHGHYAHQDTWEQTRAIMHAVVQSQSTKPVKPDDILAFPWDTPTEEEVAAKAPMSEADRERLAREAERYLTAKQKYNV